MAITKKVNKAGEARYEVRVRRADLREMSRTFRTIREAERWERDFLTRRDRGEVIDPKAARVPFGEYAVEVVAGRDLSANTRHGYERILARRILPTFGARPLASIATEEVARWLAEYRQVSPVEAAKAFRLLSMIFRAAVDTGRIARNPCAAVRGGGVEKSPERPDLEVGQVLALADAMPDRLKLFVLLAGFAGLRRGELLALRRRHVDPLHGRVHVVEAVSLFAGKSVKVEPKAGSNRVVQLAGPLVDAAREHLERWVEPEPDAFVFTGELGGPLATRSLYNAWSDARTEVGLPKVRIHDLRHHAGTLRAQLGATMREVMADLGHRTPAAAMRYQHAADRRRRELADLVADAMANAEPAARPVPLARADRGTRPSGTEKGRLG